MIFQRRNCYLLVFSLLRVLHYQKDYANDLANKFCQMNRLNFAICTDEARQNTESRLFNHNSALNLIICCHQLSSAATMRCRSYGTPNSSQNKVSTVTIIEKRHSVRHISKLDYENALEPKKMAGNE